jgi:RNA polymerase sigma factor (sigma-70 family)
MNKDFKGIVKMYDEEVHINTLTKEGYARVLERIDPLLCKWASKTYMPGYTFEDIKQELALIIIEGVNAYDPSKKVKLSTFLHTHLRNKLISKIKSVNKLSNDAYSLHEKAELEICECGGLISFKKIRNLETRDVFTKYSCEECSKEYKPNHRRSREELVFSAMPKTDPRSGEEYAEFENCLSNSDNFYSNNSTPFERVDLELAIEKLSEMIDKKTYIILRMVCLEGHSIKDAAREVGLTGWAASMRLKKLERYKVINDLLAEYLNKNE